MLSFSSIFLFFIYFLFLFELSFFGRHFYISMIIIHLFYTKERLDSTMESKPMQNLRFKWVAAYTCVAV